MKRSRLGGAVWRGLFLCLFGVGVVRPSAAQQPVEVLTLEEAVERAIRNSPAVVQAGGAVETAFTAERTAWGAFLPSFSLSSGASLSSTERFNPQTNTTVTGSNDSYSARINGSIDLFTGGRRGAELDRARAETAATEAALIEQRFAVILAAKTTFFEVLRQGELARVARARVERAQEALDAAEQRLAVESATRSDVLRAQLEHANARQTLLVAQNQQNVARFALGRLVGAAGAAGAAIQTPLEVGPLALSEAELAELVVERAPAVRSATAALGASQAGARAARAQYLPSLSASSGYNWYNDNPAFTGARGSWSLGIGLSYPLFNGFQREATVQSASVAARVARVQLQDARRFARAELERVLGALRLAEQRIEIAEQAVAVAEEDLRVQETRYRFGAATILERITSQENLVLAETDLVGARFDYQLARAELEALAGRDL